MSLNEALTNVTVGYCVARFKATLAQNMAIGAIFTLVSIVRSFATAGVRDDPCRSPQRVRAPLVRGGEVGAGAAQASMQ